MATELISIKERIERVLQAQAATMLGVGTVYRWDQRGLLDESHKSIRVQAGWNAFKDGDCLLVVDQETAEEGGEGGDMTESNASTTKTLKGQLQVKIEQAETPADGSGATTRQDAVTTAQLVNRWLLRMEMALTENPRMQETGNLGNGEMLATDTRVTATYSAPIGTGQREAMALLDFEVEYDHLRNDPAAGAGVTHFSDSFDVVLE